MITSKHQDQIFESHSLRVSAFASIFGSSERASGSNIPKGFLSLAKKNFPKFCKAIFDGIILSYKARSSPFWAHLWRGNCPKFPRRCIFSHFLLTEKRQASLNPIDLSMYCDRVKEFLPPTWRHGKGSLRLVEGGWVPTTYRFFSRYTTKFYQSSSYPSTQYTLRWLRFHRPHCGCSLDSASRQKFPKSWSNSETRSLLHSGEESHVASRCLPFHALRSQVPW